MHKDRESAGHWEAIPGRALQMKLPLNSALTRLLKHDLEYQITSRGRLQMPDGVSEPPTKEGIPSTQGRENPGATIGQVTGAGEEPREPRIHHGLCESFTEGSDLFLLPPSVAFRDLKAKKQVTLRPLER